MGVIDGEGVGYGIEITSPKYSDKTEIGAAFLAHIFTASPTMLSLNPTATKQPCLSTSMSVGLVLSGINSPVAELKTFLREKSLYQICPFQSATPVIAAASRASHV